MRLEDSLWLLDIWRYLTIIFIWRYPFSIWQCFLGLSSRDCRACIMIGLNFSVWAGNCGVIWGWTKYRAGSNLLWKSGWFLWKWRSEHFCKPVQAKSCSILCPARTVRFFLFSAYFDLLLLQWTVRRALIIMLEDSFLLLFCVCSLLCFLV